MKSVTVTSMRRGAFLGLAMLLCVGSASAQMFKWVDASGKTHFSDQPPPASAKPAAVKSSVGGGGGPQLPYALATAVRNYPVVLYTTSPCSGCDQGRSFLKARGIPFTEKTVTTAEDDAKVKEAGGNGGMPFITVGSAKTTGFESGAWTSMLNVALYPESSILPKTYAYSDPVSAGPKKVAPKATEPDREAIRVAAAAQEEKKRAAAAAAAKAASPTAPPGFQF